MKQCTDFWSSRISGGKRPRKTAPPPKQLSHATVASQVTVPSQAELPSLDYTDDAEERYEAALSILSFSRDIRNEQSTLPTTTPSAALEEAKTSPALPVSSMQIETASISELTELEKKLKQMQDMIKVERAKRRGDDLVKPGLTTRLKKTRYSTRSRELSADATSGQQNKQASTDSQSCKATGKADQSKQDGFDATIPSTSTTIIAAPLDHAEEAAPTQDGHPSRDTISVAADEVSSTDPGEKALQNETIFAATDSVNEETEAEIDSITASVVSEIIDHAVDAATAADAVLHT